MKKILLFTAVIGLSALASHASARGNSDFDLTIFDARKVTIEWDNQKTTAFNRWSKDDVTAGYHNIKIYREESYANGGHKTILYDGRIHIPDNSIVKANLDRNRNMDVDITPKRDCGTPTPQHQGRPVVKPANRPVAVPSNRPSVGRPEEGHCGNGGHGYVAMSANDFNSLLTQLDNAWFEEDRMRIAKTTIENARLNSEQVRQVVDKFWFEDSRLEFAKVAYLNTIDTQNYHVVKSAFWFAATGQVLDEYIKSLGR